MKKLIFTTLCAAVLTACGGGGDSSPAATTSPLSAITATTIALPSAVGSAPNAGTAGNLTFLRFNNSSSQTNDTAVITGSGNTSVMSFSSTPSFTVTGADSTIGSFSNSYYGAAGAKGNVLTVCTAGSSTARNSSENTYRGGQLVYISANLVPVTSISEAAGRQFMSANCAETADTNRSTVNSNGTITNSNGPDFLTLQEVTAAFSSTGVNLTGGVNIKARAYKYANTSTTFLYFLVLITTDSGGNTAVNLSYEP